MVCVSKKVNSKTIFIIQNKCTLCGTIDIVNTQRTFVLYYKNCFGIYLFRHTYH